MSNVGVQLFRSQSGLLVSEKIAVAGLGNPFANPITFSAPLTGSYTDATDNYSCEGTDNFWVIVKAQRGAATNIELLAEWTHNGVDYFPLPTMEISEASGVIRHGLGNHEYDFPPAAAATQSDAFEM